MRVPRNDPDGLAASSGRACSACGGGGSKRQRRPRRPAPHTLSAHFQHAGVVRQGGPLDQGRLGRLPAAARARERHGGAHERGGRTGAPAPKKAEGTTTPTRRCGRAAWPVESVVGKSGVGADAAAPTSARRGALAALARRASTRRLIQASTASPAPPSPPSRWREPPPPHTPTSAWAPRAACCACGCSGTSRMSSAHARGWGRVGLGLAGTDADPLTSLSLLPLSSLRAAVVAGTIEPDFAFLNAALVASAATLRLAAFAARAAGLRARRRTRSEHAELVLALSGGRNVCGEREGGGEEVVGVEAAADPCPLFPLLDIARAQHLWPGPRRGPRPGRPIRPQRGRRRRRRGRGRRRGGKPRVAGRAHRRRRPAQRLQDRGGRGGAGRGLRRVPDSGA